MKFLLQVSLVIISLYLGVVYPMNGGSTYGPGDFSFVLLVKNLSRTVCLGVIDTETTFITASRCLKRVNVSAKRTQSIASLFSATNNVPIEEVQGGKPGDAPEEGMSLFPDFATVVARANLPGLKVYARDERGNLRGRGPTYTPWPEDQEAFVENVTSIQVSGIVVGSSNMAAAMKVMTGAECDAKLEADVPERELMNAYLNIWSNNVTEKDYFCAIRGDAGGKYPPGHPCEEDLGAPFIINGSVWGTLIGAWCLSETNYTSLFRTGVRSWDYRRFDGSLTERPDTTIPNTTSHDRDDTTNPGGAAQNEVLGPIYSYFLAIIAVITMRKWFLETGVFFVE